MNEGPLSGLVMLLGKLIFLVVGASIATSFDSAEGNMRLRGQSTLVTTV